MKNVTSGIKKYSDKISRILGLEKIKINDLEYIAIGTLYWRNTETQIHTHTPHKHSPEHFIVKLLKAVIEKKVLKTVRDKKAYYMDSNRGRDDCWHWKQHKPEDNGIPSLKC